MLPRDRLCGRVVAGSPICIHAESGIAKTEEERLRERGAAAAVKNKQSSQPKVIGWPWVQQRCRWRMGRMNVTPSKFCMEIADLYLQVDEAVKRAVLS